MKSALSGAFLAVSFVSTLGFVSSSATAKAGAVPAVKGGDGPLEYAFKFASAIKKDPKDMGRMQQGVVLDYAYIGDLDTAVRRSRKMIGWRRGVVQAELARQLALANRKEEARSLIEDAEDYRKGIEGWQNPRIASHIARALAALGETEESRQMSSKLASNDPLQYSGRSMAIVASARATEGKFDEAMMRLDALSTDRDFEVTWWRTHGYLDIARRSELTPEQRGRALAEARESANNIKGWRRADALIEIADEFRLMKKRAEAREALEAGESIVTAMPETASARVRLLGDAARAWSRLGEKERGSGLLDEAIKLVPETLIVDRPGLYAVLAASYMVLSDEDKAWDVYDTAFGSAESLVNARPRAMAVVSICRSMGRNGIQPTDETRARLDTLYAGLKDPW